MCGYIVFITFGKFWTICLQMLFFLFLPVLWDLNDMWGFTATAILTLHQHFLPLEVWLLLRGGMVGIHRASTETHHTQWHQPLQPDRKWVYQQKCGQEG